ncbi:hypothetical protein CHS0354_030107 [Potamilus streckersoni]|uniref:Ferrochelatase n=1 Tax=Potamilus streckersoni TaxID=2493646 RepID=A0AAE0VGF8_9BIVA|nr:hypothetical protein CHS0354_030107 [Potamilus streckersoni]
MAPKKGILLINLGTPDSLEIADLRRYLREFLSDRRVLTVPAPLRWLLLNLIILPFRPRKIRENYSKIWTPEGSPLDVYAKKLSKGISDILGGEYQVAYAMRYGNPRISDKLSAMTAQGITDVLVVPLFPQYAMATTGSLYARVFELLQGKYHIPSVSFLGDYYDKDFFTGAQAEIARPYLEKPYDKVVFTYHATHAVITATANRTAAGKITEQNAFCYQAQCHATSRSLAAKLSIPEDKYIVSFQSRFGPAEWIQPYTTDVLKKLGKNGGRVVVMCPAFTADCVETLEEINEEERETFMHAGGKEYDTVPCVNDHPLWINGLAREVQRFFSARPN